MDCSTLYTWIENSSYEWTDEAYIQWGECYGDTLSTLRQVWLDLAYAYAVTSSGLNIFDIETNNKVAYVYVEDGYTTIWGSDTTIYLGTESEGIKYIVKSTILVDAVSPIDLEAFVNTYDFYYNASSVNIKYLHGNLDTLAVVTPVGIDIINNGPNGYKSSVSNTHITKCFLTENREVYYIEQDEEYYDRVLIVFTCLVDWEVPDVSYVADGTTLASGISINDIFVTTNTSISGNNNSIFIATSSGAYVIDEESSLFDIYSTTLAGQSIDIRGIWADNTTSRIIGKMYTTSFGIGAALSVVDMSTGSLYDRYTIVDKGRVNKTLATEEIIDIVAGSN